MTFPVPQVGDPVLMLRNNTVSYVGTFTLPAPFNGMQCHDGNPISELRIIIGVLVERLQTTSCFACGSEDE